MRAELLTDAVAAEALAPAWDALAVELGSPVGAPGWMLAWFRRMAEPGAALRVAAVRDDDGALRGVLPFVLESGPGGPQLRILGAGVGHRVTPLAQPADVAAVAAAGVPLLAGAPGEVASLRLEGHPHPSPWPAALAAAWPGRRRPWVHLDYEQPAPVSSLAGGYDGWRSRRSSSFRKRMGNMRRRLERDGCVVRTATAASLDHDLPELFRLNHSRWADRGGTNALDEAREAFLRDIVAAQIDAGRARLWMIDAPDGIVASAQLFFLAGSEMTYWGGGFDEAWSKHTPALVSITAAVEDAADRGVQTLDLGGGDSEYKRRVADDEPRRIGWTTIVPRGPRHLRARLAWAPIHARFTARDRVRDLSPEQRERLRAARDRLAALRPGR